jgi:hypothetical protein
MGSKRDGVRVEYAKHHIRTGKKVRAMVRAGTHPSQVESPRHRSKAKPRKFQAYIIHASGHRRKVGSYATVKGAESAIKSERTKGGALFGYYIRKWGEIVGHEVARD